MTGRDAPATIPVRGLTTSLCTTASEGPETASSGPSSFPALTEPSQGRYTAQAMATPKHRIVVLRAQRDRRPFIECACGKSYHHPAVLAPAHAENELLDWYNQHNPANGSR